MLGAIISHPVFLRKHSLLYDAEVIMKTCFEICFSLAMITYHSLDLGCES
jgi:hypothetical protein